MKFLKILYFNDKDQNNIDQNLSLCILGNDDKNFSGKASAKYFWKLQKAFLIAFITILKYQLYYLLHFIIFNSLSHEVTRFAK